MYKTVPFAFHVVNLTQLRENERADQASNREREKECGGRRAKKWPRKGKL